MTASYFCCWKERSCFGIRTPLALSSLFSLSSIRTTAQSHNISILNMSPRVNIPSSRQFELSLHVLCSNHQKAMLPREKDPLEQTRRWEADEQSQKNGGKSIAQIRWKLFLQIEQYLLMHSPNKSANHYRDEICLVARLVERTMFILSRSLETYQRADNSELLIKRIQYICFEHAKKIVKNQRIHKKSSLKRQLAQQCKRKSAAGAA